MASEIQLTAATKLEPYLLMSKSAKGAGAAKLVQDATSAPGVLVFSELLEVSNIKEVRFSKNPFHTERGVWCSWRARCLLIERDGMDAVGEERATLQVLLALAALCVQDVSGLRS